MSATLSGFSRFLHWGPMTAISIIKCITLTTLYMNSMWWPPNQTIGGFLHQLLFVCFSTLSSYNYIMATIYGPGYMPFEWKPKNPKDAQFLQYCKECKGFKAPRSHHCRKCQRCVKKMDHHCPWINNCVGWANHAYFTGFLLFSILGSLHACVILACTFYRGLYRYWYLAMGLEELATVNFSLLSIIFCILSMGLSVGVVIALSMLLYFQIKSILTNQTGIEMWIVEKAIFRRKYSKMQLEPFIYPYDLGWKQNVKQVFDSKCLAKGSGIEWPIIDNCHEYALTCEQLSQKVEKRARTMVFKCIRPSAGSIFPFWSHGFRVACSPPCTDEPRIRLQIGDTVRVTRFREHWLFGERNLSELEKKAESQRKGALRGWFPRRCVMEFIEPDFDDLDEQTHVCPETKTTKVKPLNGHKVQNGAKKKAI